MKRISALFAVLLIFLFFAAGLGFVRIQAGGLHDAVRLSLSDDSRVVVTVSQGWTDHIKSGGKAVSSSLSLLPFYIVDGIEVIEDALSSLFALFGDLLSNNTPPPDHTAKV